MTMDSSGNISSLLWTKSIKTCFYFLLLNMHCLSLVNIVLVIFLSSLHANNLFFSSILFHIFIGILGVLSEL